MRYIILSYADLPRVSENPARTQNRASYQVKPPVRRRQAVSMNIIQESCSNIVFQGGVLFLFLLKTNNFLSFSFRFMVCYWLIIFVCRPKNLPWFSSLELTFKHRFFATAFLIQTHCCLLKRWFLFHLVSVFVFLF